MQHNWQKNTEIKNTIRKRNIEYIFAQERKDIGLLQIYWRVTSLVNVVLEEDEIRDLKTPKPSLH